MDNIDKRIELLHKVQEEMDRRERIQEEAYRLHMAGDFQKEGELMQVCVMTASCRICSGSWMN